MKNLFFFNLEVNEDGCSDSCFLLIKSNGLIDTFKCRCPHFNSSFVKSNQVCSNSGKRPELTFNQFKFF